MKLRVRGDSIRLRLTQREVSAMGAGQEVSEKTTFGASEAFIYSVTTSKTATKIEASFTNNVLTVSVPAELATAWAHGTEVGIGNEQPNGDGRLMILIEKDFACLKPRAEEDDRDAFPNPSVVC